jgi:hypothetical protein
MIVGLGLEGLANGKLRSDTVVSKGRQECTYCSVARLKYTFNAEAPSVPPHLLSTNNSAKHFIYADDSASAIQGNQFKVIEEKLTKTLETMSNYYNDNHFKPNPSKTLVCTFRFKNKEANRNLQITWEGALLTHCKTPTYLGVTLDRTLTFKSHSEKTAKKINTRNCLIRKLTGSTWGDQPHALRMLALALCFFVGEYASPV